MVRNILLAIIAFCLATNLYLSYRLDNNVHRELAPIVRRFTSTQEPEPPKEDKKWFWQN